MKKLNKNLVSRLRKFSFLRRLKSRRGRQILAAQRQKGRDLNKRYRVKHSKIQAKYARG